ncbi:MAG TPA: hypothetical protein VFQ35_01675, partial [Polyangiaceae bacterium]|nr:hypothetical protein [Polyangiaceae bacterium]
SGPWQAMDAVSFAWSWVTKDFGGVALPLAVGWFVMLLPQSLLGGARGFAQSFLLTSGAIDADTATLIGLIMTPISAAVGVLSQAYFLGGITRFALTVARGRKPEFGEVFAGGSTFGAMFVGQLLFTLAIGIGFMLCLVPGVIIAIACQFYALFIVDKQLSGVEGLKASWEITKGHRGNLLVLSLVLAGVMLLGAAACCIGFLLIAAPMQVLAQSYVYLKLHSEEPSPAA